MIIINDINNIDVGLVARGIFRNQILGGKNLFLKKKHFEFPQKF